jgi:hypothetical protein
MELLDKLPNHSKHHLERQMGVQIEILIQHWKVLTLLEENCLACFICLQFLGFVKLQSLRTQKSHISKLGVLGFQEF